MTVKIQGNNSTALPGITGGDTDTGIQLGTNEVKIVTGGTDRVVVDSTGASTFNKVLKVNRTVSGDGCFHAALNGTVNASIASNGSATFNGPVKIGGSAAVNEIDEYEEGTWTPNLPMGGTISVQGSRYTKIGRQVLLYLYAGVSSTPNNNSEFQIAGLPFTADSPSYFPSGNIGFSSTFNMDPWRPLVRGGTSLIYFHRLDGSSITARNSNVTGLGEIVITIAYCAA